MSFADEIARFQAKALDRANRVFRRAVTLLGEELAKPRPEGGTPHLTGNLIRSILARVNGPVNVKPDGDDGEGNFFGTDVGLAVAGAVIGDTITIGFQAVYAARVNFGFVGEDKLGRYYNQQGAHFVERAAAMWPQFVDQAVREVKANG